MREPLAMPASRTAAGPDDAGRPPRREVLAVPTGDGATLAVEHIPAAAPAVGAAWVAHAMMANRRSLDRPRGRGFASRLAEAGIEVYLADLRGHGGSSPAPSWRYDEIVREDLPALTRFVRARHPSLPVAGIGHSLAAHGALAGLATGAAPPLDAVVSIAGNIWLRSLEPSPLRWARKRALTEAFLAVARACDGRFPARRLGMGTEDVSSSFVEDLARWIRSGRFDARDGTDYLGGFARIRTPVIAVLGAGDRLLCHPTAGARFHARLVEAPLEVIVAGRPELPFDPDHMSLVTDERARPLWDEVARRLARRLVAAAPGDGAGGAGSSS